MYMRRSNLMSNKLLLLLPLSLSLVGCNQNIVEIKDGTVLVHPYVVYEGKMMMETFDISADIGEDLSSKIAITYQEDVWNDGVNFPLAVYKDKNEKELLETSKLQSYDNSYKEVYVKCEYLRYLDIYEYLRGEYQNSYSNKLTVLENHMEGNVFEDYTFSNDFDADAHYCLMSSNLHIYKDGEEVLVENDRTEGLSIGNGYYKDGEWVKNINYQYIGLGLLSDIVYGRLREMHEENISSSAVEYMVFYRYHQITS